MKFLILSALMCFASSAFAYEKMCGFSDEVYDYLLKENGGKKFETKAPMTGKQGETERIFMSLNGKWLLTFEFYSAGDVSQDVTCIVATGNINDDGLFDFISSRIPALPEKLYGSLANSAEARQILKRFQP